MKNKTMRWILICSGAACLGIFLVFVAGGFDLFVQATANLNDGTDAVIVSERSDPYYRLAEQIARSDSLPLVHSLDEAVKSNPRFMILVASPKNLDEARLLSIGEMFKRLDDYPALGIITGSTIAHAEQLWLRRHTVGAGGYYLGGDTEKGLLIDAPVLLDISADAGEESELNKDNLTGILQQAAYFYWARHVTETKWFWNSESEDYGEEDNLYAEDLSNLPAVVIYTPSCGSFQPWVEDSIALGFVDKGAAAYAGHVHSPISNAFLMRNGVSVPGIYTWEEFPLGIMVQIQNKMSARAIHHTPLFFMLGDPRIYLFMDRPYQVISDVAAENGRREITGISDSQGVLAVKIEDGAGYKFLRINGVAAASEGDIFYNNHLQELSLGADKYILFFHNGGEFEISLYQTPPFGWVLFDALRDALDYSWVVIGVIYSPIALVFLAVLAALLLIKTICQKIAIKDYRFIFLMGFGFAVLRLVYLLLRVDAYSVSATVADYTLFKLNLGLTGMFASTSAGLILLRDSRKVIVKVMGLLVAVFPQFLLTAFYFVNITLTNMILITNNPVPYQLWNYSAFWLPLIVLVLESAFILILTRLSQSWEAAG